MMRTRIGLPRAALLGGVLATFALLPTTAAAADITYFAGPEGKGEVCSESAPCSLSKAVGLAGDGDSVRMLPGEYQPPLAGVSVSKEIDLGGVPGAVPIVRTTSTGTIQVTAPADATLHDIDFIGQGNLPLESGTAERVSVAYTGQKVTLSDAAACELGAGTTLRDSLCWANEAAEETSANGVESFIFGEGIEANVVLRNVTAIAADKGGSGLVARAAFGTRLKVDASGVIARAAHQVDVSMDTPGEGGFPKVVLSLVHSNYGTEAEELPNAVGTPAGTAGNQTEAPYFTNPEIGDFHVLPASPTVGSPTIDAAVVDAHTGALDLDGSPRAQPGCLGAPALPDIGAYELAGTGTCPPRPPRPPEPPKPPEPRKPVFRILKVSLHGAGGSIQVETPGAGMLTLTGSGVKLVTRATAGPTVVKMPIQPWAITLVRVKRTGKTKVRLKVRFASLGGAPREKTRSIVLKKP
jgi:hypothetical protein